MSVTIPHIPYSGDALTSLGHTLMGIGERQIQREAQDEYSVALQDWSRSTNEFYNDLAKEGVHYSEYEKRWAAHKTEFEGSLTERFKTRAGREQFMERYEFEKIENEQRLSAKAITSERELKRDGYLDRISEAVNSGDWDLAEEQLDLARDGGYITAVEYDNLADTAQYGIALRRATLAIKSIGASKGFDAAMDYAANDENFRYMGYDETEKQISLDDRERIYTTVKQEAEWHYQQQERARAATERKLFGTWTDKYIDLRDPGAENPEKIYTDLLTLLKDEKLGSTNQRIARGLLDQLSGDEQAETTEYALAILAELEASGAPPAERQEAIETLLGDGELEIEDFRDEQDAIHDEVLESPYATLTSVSKAGYLADTPAKSNENRLALNREIKTWIFAHRDAHGVLPDAQEIREKLNQMLQPYKTEYLKRTENDKLADSEQTWKTLGAEEAWTMDHTRAAMRQATMSDYINDTNNRDFKDMINVEAFRYRWQRGLVNPNDPVDAAKMEFQKEVDAKIFEEATGYAPQGFLETDKGFLIILGQHVKHNFETGEDEIVPGELFKIEIRNNSEVLLRWDPASETGVVINPVGIMEAIEVWRGQTSQE